jgi:3-phenylpropionate/trans-cinnamate dioxygenase ferredoxin subunit
MGQWYPAVKKDDVKPGHGTQVSLEGKILAVFNLEGKFYAIDDTCTHAGGSLAEGPVAGTVVTCPWHGATFDIVTGAVLSDPAYEGVNAYKVKLEGDDVLVEL